jgi:hypothetical protein
MSVVRIDCMRWMDSKILPPWWQRYNTVAEHEVSSLNKLGPGPFSRYSAIQLPGVNDSGGLVRAKWVGWVFAAAHWIHLHPQNLHSGESSPHNLFIGVLLTPFLCISKANLSLVTKSRNQTQAVRVDPICRHFTHKLGLLVRLNRWVAFSGRVVDLRSRIS